MAEQMTPEQVIAARRAIRRAHDEVHAIAKEGPRRWLMSIPAQPDVDSDLVLSAALEAGEDALAEVERLRAQLATPVQDEEVAVVLRVLKAGDGTRRDALTLERVIQQAEADRDAARAEVKQLRAMYDDLCGTVSRTGTRLATAERERDTARDDRDRLAEQVRVLAGVLKRGGPEVRCSGHRDRPDPDCATCRDAEILRAALRGTEAGS